MRIKEIYKKNKEIINYLIFGVLTTVVSFVVRFGILKAGELFGITADESSAGYSATAIYALRVFAQVMQWVAGVLFSFFTNRKWVFENGTSGNMGVQLIKFSGSRVFSFGVDSVINLGLVAALDAINFPGFTVPFVDYTVGPDGIAWFVAAVVVTILNYITSKLLVFRSGGSDRKGSAV